MRPQKINDSELLRLLDKEKLTQTEVGKRLGVTRQAISARICEIRGRNTQTIVADKLKEVVDQKIDAIAQLYEINKKANDLLIKAEKDDDRHTVVRCMSEIRNQLDLQLKIFQAMYDLKSAEEFQATVLEVIGSIDSSARRKILEGLNSKRSIRSALRYG